MSLPAHGPTDTTNWPMCGLTTRILRSRSVQARAEICLLTLRGRCRRRVRKAIAELLSTVPGQRDLSTPGPEAPIRPLPTTPTPWRARLESPPRGFYVLCPEEDASSRPRSSLPTSPNGSPRSWPSAVARISSGLTLSSKTKISKMRSGSNRICDW